MAKNLKNVLKIPKKMVLTDFGVGSPGEGWEPNPWGLSKQERKPCGYYQTCPDSKRCDKYGRVRKKNAKKFYSQCSTYSWPLEQKEKE